jgi:hypothetical protein
MTHFSFPLIPLWARGVVEVLGLVVYLISFVVIVVRFLGWLPIGLRMVRKN